MPPQPPVDAKPQEGVYEPPRCEALPLPGSQISFRIDGRERTRWHFGKEYPRPFLFPLAGPSGTPLTRMGHPGDWTHDHHRSVWFAHDKVEGLDFWSENTPCRIEQKQWLAIQEGPAEAVLGVVLSWFDGHRVELMRQETVFCVRPADDEAETLVEVQARFTPLGKELVLKQTNFGFFAVRVAKSLSAHFGGGRLRGADGRTGEPALFGQPNRWMDYSGPVTARDWEGISYFSHRANAEQIPKWHVRSDGWMGASVCRDAAITLTPAAPFQVRYLLHAHRGDVDPARAETIADAFDRSPPWKVEAVKTGHTKYKIARIG